jgi:hypothetical protein
MNLDRARRWGLPLDHIVNPLGDPLAEFELDNENHRDALKQKAHYGDTRLIVIDSLSGAHKGREKDSAMMQLVKHLAELARDTGKPILCTHHLRKRGLLDGVELDLDRVRGSSAIVQPARIVWAIDIPDALMPESRRLSVIKSNLAKFPEPVGFVIGDDGVFFTDAPEAPRVETVADKAADLLLAILADGPMETRQVQEEAIGAGISWPSMTRAKKRLGIKAVKSGKVWHWGLPARKGEIVH